MKNQQIITHITEYETYNELSDIEQGLVIKAIDTAKKAYAPYSNFKVGAAILLENGEIITGNNQENAAYPSGLCAERVAMFYANAKYPNVAVKAVTVTVVKNGEVLAEPAPPCGSCRQVMLETEVRFGQAIKIYMAGQHRVLSVDSAKSLLPITFDKNYLK